MPVGVAQTNGVTCGPEKIGPPMSWLVIVRDAPWPVTRSAERREIARRFAPKVLVASIDEMYCPSHMSGCAAVFR